MIRHLLPLLFLAACAAQPTGLPLTLGPSGASGTLDGGDMVLSVDGTTCTARLDPIDNGISGNTLLSGPLACADGRAGKAQLASINGLPDAWDGVVELDGATTRVTYGTAPDPAPHRDSL